jgi:ubiquinone/menaquinone biosynthesis C-methylase UbiE
MRDPWGLNERAFAKWYPTVVGWSEDAGQRDIRAELIAGAHGRTLEIGAGSGHNLAHYTTSVTELVVTEPSPHMLEQLRACLTDDPPPVGSWELVQTGAEALPFDDRTFDTVIATYVHCTIPDPPAALREIARVLRPGGQYIFLEHVRAPDNRMLARFQDLLETPHSYIAAGCHPNRRMERLLAESPLSVRSLKHARMPRCFPTVRPTIRGIATADMTPR